VKKVALQFSRSNYSEAGFLQDLIAKNLVQNISTKNKSVLDLGCGTGFVLKNIDPNFRKFWGVDLSLEMLSKHPKKQNVKTILLDFDEVHCFADFDIIVSSSALQWSKNLKSIFAKLEELKGEVHLAIFTNNTFKELHSELEIVSPILSMQEILDFANGYFFNVERGVLEFENQKEILEYIKNSGVSGGLNKVKIKKLKKFLKSSDLTKVSFEVVYLHRFGKIEN
jgi:malonyl-CoA O-methyltransferase